MEIQEQEQFAITAKETSNTNSSNEEIVQRTEIKNTPFRHVKTEHGGFIALGQYKLTDKTETMAEAKETVGEGIDWEFLCAVIGAISKQTVDTYKGEL